MSIDILLQAAEFIDRRDSENEHGYACNVALKPVRELQKAKIGNRRGPTLIQHLNTERVRRANVRNCIERLKSVVPLGPVESRHTVYSLLNNSTKYIRSLQQKGEMLQAKKLSLAEEQQRLKRRLKEIYSTQLDGKDGHCENSESAHCVVEVSDLLLEESVLENPNVPQMFLGREEDYRGSSSSGSSIDSQSEDDSDSDFSDFLLMWRQSSNASSA